MTIGRLFCFFPGILLVVALAVPTSVWSQQEAENESMTLNRVLIAREIQNREPLETEGPFIADGERLYVYLDVCNPTGEQQELTVIMHHLDRDRSTTQTVDVGPSRRWRTWVYHRMRSSQAGQWRVEIHDPTGALLLELTFEVVRAP